jgi:hypothetical protein
MSNDDYFSKSFRKERNILTIQNSKFKIQNYVLQWGFKPQRKTGNP